MCTYVQNWVITFEFKLMHKIVRQHITHITYTGIPNYKSHPTDKIHCFSPLSFLLMLRELTTANWRKKPIQTQAEEKVSIVKNIKFRMLHRQITDISNSK